MHPIDSRFSDLFKKTFLLDDNEYVIPKAVPHQWWNDSNTESVKMQVKIEPALNTEIFFEQFFGLSNDGKTKKDGSPSFMQIMTMNNTYEIYMAGPPLLVQMGIVFGSVGRLLGYKKHYADYSEKRNLAA